MTTERFMREWEHYADHQYYSTMAEEQARIDAFVLEFLHAFSQPEYVIPPEYRMTFIQLNPLISNVVAMSCVGTTDAWLAVVGRQRDNLAKILTLYSARNTTWIDPAHLFAANPTAASLWYCQYLRTFPSSLCDKDAADRLVRVVRHVDPRWKAPHALAEIYFGATYIDGESERAFKTHLNGLVGRQVSVCESVNPRRIGVCTAFWYREHSACRIQYDFVASLQADYELVLVQLEGPPEADIDTRIFREVVKDPAGCRMLYFPDVGMTAESVVMANRRSTPIQVTTYGHPVSVWGGEVDYFIVGAESEDLPLLRYHYGERAVVLPGLGVVQARPKWERKGVEPASGPVRVNCSWYAQKVNGRLVAMLKQILDRVDSEVVFCLWVGSSLNKANHYLPFVKTMRAALGAEHVEVRPAMPFADYMDILEAGHLALDSYPFGGSNVVIDSLHAGRPIVCREGSHWYNRIGPAWLRRLGLGDLIAQSEYEYVEKAARLIDNRRWREEMTAQVRGLDLDEQVYSQREVPSFKRAIDLLMREHETLQAGGSREPIWVS
ncbi:MAG TPA: hypothetical protein VGO93_17900 [Candidatus Xenobia bacterium]|jgi:hypothetical protein